jgi:hypothetical protein
MRQYVHKSKNKEDFDPIQYKQKSSLSQKKNTVQNIVEEQEYTNSLTKNVYLLFVKLPEHK